jgi:polyphosphate kinase 2 (PPK2 family)
MSILERTIEELFASRRLTRRDQEKLMSLFSQRDLSAKDAMLINRVYDALNQGRLRVVD